MTNNKMICDIGTGMCGEAGNDAMELIDLNQPQKKITLYYVTDPICSHCWALEPVLRKFEEQYGHYFELHTVMGGLLESWDGFADVANGISSPTDVAGHWREVGVKSRMPIDGSLWLDNPVHSSFTPSRVFKMIQQKDEQMARTFLRRAREAVFAFNENIGDEQVLINIVNQIGLDGEQIVRESGLSDGHELLNQDFALAKSLGVRGFPTVIMVNEVNKGIKIVGARPIENYVSGLEQILGTTET
ncbi:MAG: DsbA family protein, partial [Bacillus sp. (in: Bacteria)]|nr:DsbA family protein [Bacillus sp. (in: firmicutes)]